MIYRLKIISDVVFTVGFENVILNEFRGAGSKKTDALVSLDEWSLPINATKGSVIMDGDGFLILLSYISINATLEVDGNRPDTMIVLMIVINFT